MNRWILAVLALVVGFGVGWSVFHAKQPFAAKGVGVVHHVKVFQKDDNDKADPEVEPVKVYMSRDDLVAWRHVGRKAKDVHIEFEKEVFSGMTQVGTAPDIRWAISNCKGEGCLSFWPKVDPSDEEYKYWQILNDPVNPNSPPKEKDGWIIIR